MTQLTHDSSYLPTRGEKKWSTQSGLKKISPKISMFKSKMIFEDLQTTLSEGIPFISVVCRYLWGLRLGVCWDSLRYWNDTSFQDSQSDENSSHLWGWYLTFSLEMNLGTLMGTEHGHPEKKSSTGWNLFWVDRVVFQKVILVLKGLNFIEICKGASQVFFVKTMGSVTSYVITVSLGWKDICVT